MGIPVWQRRDDGAQHQATLPEPPDIQEIHATVHLANSSTASPEGATEDPDIRHLDWADLEARVAACERCGLCENRRKTVFGVGDRGADLLVIGEAPGAEEDRRGEPFVGRAGRLLDQMLRAITLERGRRVYIANILKCRPPGNRDPQAEEMSQCTPYLDRQIALIRPRVILAVGRIAAQYLLRTDKPLKALRQQQWHYPESEIPVVVSYHPSYLLRTPGDKGKAWQDLKRLIPLLGAGSATESESK